MHESLRITNVGTSINDEIFVPLNFLWMPINLLLMNFVCTIKVILNNIELGCPVHDGGMHYFPESEVKWAYLPTGVASKKQLGFFVARSNQRHAFFTITRNGKVGKLFQKSLFPLLQRELILLAIHLLLNGPIYRFTDLIKCLLLIVLPKIKDLIWLYSTVLERFYHYRLGVLEQGIFISFQDFQL